MKGSRALHRVASFVLLGLSAGEVLAAGTTPVHMLARESWLEIKGTAELDGTFKVESMEQIAPQRYVELLGAVEVPRPRTLSVAGVAVALDTDTELKELERAELEGRRVKVEGRFVDGRSVVARRVAARESGRDRLVGRIDSLSCDAQHCRLALLGQALDVPARAPVTRTAAAISGGDPHGAYAVANLRDKDEERFGRGWELAPGLRLAIQSSVETLRRENFDLDDDDDDARNEVEAQLRARFAYAPGGAFSAIAELKYTGSFRNEQQEPDQQSNILELGDAYVRWIPDSRPNMSLTVGRQHFDDAREWLFDTRLDAIRFNWRGRYVSADMAVGTVLFDGDAADRDAINTLLYLSNGSDRRHLAVYGLQRDFGNAAGDNEQWFGARASGEWLERSRNWLDVAWNRGKRSGRSVNGFGYDVGTSVDLLTRRRLYVTAGYASATGDDANTSDDETFRQTRLHDNAGRFGGLASFRYYGELLRPELANLSIVTTGIGTRALRWLSIDLLRQSYRLERSADRLIAARTSRSLQPGSRDLGDAYELVLGVRRGDRWDLKAIASYLQPGPAFDDRDPAQFARMEFRYRF